MHAEQLLEVLVPLPDGEIQRRIAKMVDTFMLKVVEARTRSKQSSKLASLASDGVIHEVLKTGADNGWPFCAVEEIAQINPRPDRLRENDPVTFVSMAAVDDLTGTIASPALRVAGEVQGGYRQFRRGDVIFARITPCMQNGKAAVADLETEFAFGSTEFHVIRPGPDVLPEWIHRIVRTRRFREEAEKRFTGTAGQQRVPAVFLRQARIPVPRTVAEQRRALARIDHILEIDGQIRRRHALQLERLAALETSILNEAFGGRL